MHAIELAMPGTPAWDEARLTGIGGSEICAAAGERLPPEFRSRHSTRYEVAARKLGLLPEWEGNAYTRRGKRAESFVIATMLEETPDMEGVGLDRYPMPMLRHSNYPWIICTPDALLTNGDGCEAKTSTIFAARGWGEENTDQIPPDALCQAQIECECMDVDVVHVPLMLDIWRLKLYCVRRNDTVIRVLIDAAGELWDMIQRGQLPEPQYSHPSMLEVIKAVHRDILPGQIVKLSQAAKEAAWRRLGIAQEQKFLKQEDDEKKAILADEIGDSAAGDLEDGYVVRRAEIHRAGYEVAPTSYIELRRVKLETFTKG